MALYYVWRNCAGAVFVKEASFFASQGGLTEPWGAAWTAVEAESVEAARDLGKAMPARAFHPTALSRVSHGRVVFGVGDEDDS